MLRDTSIRGYTPIEHLKDSVLKNPEVRKVLSTYYMLRSQYWLLGFQSNEMQNRSDDEIKKATCFLERPEVISYDNYAKTHRSIVKTRKRLKKEADLLYKDKLNREINNKMGKIPLDFGKIKYASALLSIFFLAGGFLYNYLYFKFFGFNASDYYGISDYLESSLDVIFPIFITISLSLLAFKFGTIETVKDEVHKKQTGTTRKSIKISNIEITIVAIILPTFFAVVSFNQGLPFAKPITLPAMFLIIKILVGYLKIGNYFSDQIVAVAATIAIVMFITFITGKAYDETFIVKNGLSVGTPKMEFVDGTEDLSEYTYMRGNSKYIFLYHTSNAEVKIISRSKVQDITYKSGNTNGATTKAKQNVSP